MKILIIFALAIFSLSSADFVEKIEPHIVGGTESQWGQFASSVIIDGPNEFCGGTIVDRRHILTAARCVLNDQFELINPIWFRVIAGDIFFSPASFRRNESSVSRIFVHEDYNPFTGANDLAILRLSTNLPITSNTIEIARRQTRIVPTNVQCQLVAFGRVANTTVTFRPRQAFLTLNQLERDACVGAAQPNIHANRLQETQMCIQTTAVAAPCAGNLGSGLYCNDFFAGVLTGGIACNITPAIFQQVRAYNRWIEEVFMRHDNDANEAGSIPFRSTQGLPSRVRIQEFRWLM